MEAKEAYEAIVADIEADPSKRILSRRFEEQAFGSFAVSFKSGSDARCVINDRGFVFVTDDVEGIGEATPTVPSLHDHEPGSLLQALKL
ncbi:hypothetical protein [Sphingomonas sp. LHG3443-2]|uniref:hypothetical protein n=1 Tax=Sphingomonas sp. LHG3443-2 TaxID=2804639 RepID=UPI003CF71278